MTEIDPWASEVPATPAPEPVKTVVQTPAAAAASGGNDEVVLTFKAGTGFDSPWIVIHAASLQDAYDQVSGEKAGLLKSLMTAVAGAGQFFTTHSGGKAATPAQQRPAFKSSAPPAGASEAPNDETRQCAHGDMTFKSGVAASSGKPWKGFFCPTPKGTAGQCAPEFLR